ncbi:hypothetical protein [Flavobacterium adhaerens]|uniref:hypothetical protein n=1 Tax=Flavobacterium adhaerens TaxID=3149043 RepID=UPI0032B52BC0
MKRFTKKVLFTSLIIIGTTIVMSAKARIPFGKIDKIEIVADLPNEDKYLTVQGSKDYLDLATLHQEYNIAWIFPIWITQEPKLVLAKKDTDFYYELTDQQLSEIIKENKLDKESLLQLGFYTRYGGKIILLIVAGLILYGIMPSKEEDEEDEEFKKVQPTNN